MTMTWRDDFPSILCDGKTLVVVHGEEVYVWDDYWLNSLDYNVYNEFIDCYNLVGGHVKAPLLMDSSLSLNFKIGKPKVINKRYLKIGKDLFNNLSVNELLGIIKSKLKGRIKSNGN